MQFGNPKSCFKTFCWSSFIAIAITFFVWGLMTISVQKLAALFLNLEGTALLASAFTASGHLPAQGNLIERFLWFFKSQGAVPVYYYRPMFYGGLGLLAVSFIINVVAG